MHPNEQSSMNTFIGRKRQNVDYSSFKFCTDHNMSTHIKKFGNTYIEHLDINPEINYLEDFFNSSNYDFDFTYIDNTFNTDIKSNNYFSPIPHIIPLDEIDNIENIEKENIKEKEQQNNKVLPIISKNIKKEIKNTSKYSQEISIIIDLKEDKNPLFNAVYPKKNLLFTQSKTCFIEGFESNNKYSKKRIRCTIPRNRGDYDDDIRRMIKRRFLNKILLNKINIILRNGGNKHFFARFYQKFASDVAKKRNKEIINITLRQIFEKKDLNKSKEKYRHNLEVLDSIKKEKNWELDRILNMKFCSLFEEYINSDEFKIDEINRLKKKNKLNVFIERYIYLSMHFIEYYSK